MNSIILFFSIIAFLFMCGFGIALPSLPLAILNLGYTEVEAGLVISSWAITYVIFSVIAGLLAERIGVSYALSFGLAGNSIIALIYIITNTLPYFILGRMLQGIFESLIWVSIYGSVAYLFPQAKVKSLGIVSASSTLGFSFGLFLNGPLMSTFDLKFTFLPYLFISFLCAIIAYLKVSQFNLKMTSETRIENPLKSLKEINLSAVLIMAMAFFLGCFDGVFQANSDKVAELSGLPSTFGGLFLSTYYISSLLSQYMLAMFRREITNPSYTSFTFTLVSILFCSSAIVSIQYPFSLLIWVTLGIVIGTNVIVFMSHISGYLKSKSTAMGLYQASWGFGYMLAPPLAGFILRIPLFMNVYTTFLIFLISNALISVIRLMKKYS
ncbi:MAG: MFS transporter [Thermoproteota archaeon]